MNRLHSFVLLRLISGDLMRMIEEIRNAGIQIYDFKMLDELTAQFLVNAFDQRRIQIISENYGCELCIYKKVGLAWGFKYTLLRPILAAGCVAIILLTLCIPTKVYFVQVEGNQRIESERIKEAAEQVGIGFGVSRRKIRSEKVKNAILKIMPELQWVGVTTNGCVAKISVTERDEPSITEKKTVLGNIVAARDGVILSCTALKGNLLCRVGQTVVTGETLISRYMDCGAFIRESGAEGEIIAATHRQIHICFPKMWYRKMNLENKKRNISLILGKKRINLWKDSGISDVTYDRIYKEYYADLPGEFHLPVAIAIESCTQRGIETAEVSIEDMASWLEEFADSYLRTQMVAGIIQSKQVSVSRQNMCLCLKGEYDCTEMIGRVQREEIGALYE